MKNNSVFFKNILSSINKNNLPSDKIRQALEKKFYVYYWNAGVLDEKDMSEILKEELASKKVTFLVYKAYLYDRYEFEEKEFNLSITIEK